LVQIEAGHRLGCTTIMIKNGENRGNTKNENRADYTALNLAEAVDLILHLDSAERRNPNVISKLPPAIQ